MRKVLFLWISCVLLSGCWDRIELNDVGIVTGIAVDPGEKKMYRMTIGTVNSSQLSKQGGEGNAPVVTFSLEGDTLSELSDKMNIGLSRRLIFSHTRVLAINEQIAREGKIKFLDFIDRNLEFRNDFNILIVKDQDASNIIQVVDPVEKVPSLKIHRQVQSLIQDWGGDPHVRLTDFLSAVDAKGREAVTGVVSIKGNPKKGRSTDNLKTANPETLVVIDGMAVFNGTKMLGFLTEEDSRNYLWTQDLKKTNLSVPCKKGSKDFMGILVVRSRTKQNVTYKDGIPQVEVRIGGEASIQGFQCNMDLTKVDTFIKKQKVVEQYVENTIEKTIVKVQKEYGVDIFGFGETLNRQDHQRFLKVADQWNDEFKRADVHVNATIKLIRSGTKNRSYLMDIPKESKEE